MKHIAIHGFSRKSGNVWPCHGLGDRVMLLILACNYSKRHNTPVTIHMNNVHAQYKESWEELQTLMPVNTVFYRWHKVKPMQDNIWLEYLKMIGASNVSLYYFGVGNEAPFADLNFHNYINESPLIKPTVESSVEASQYMVCQWDAREESRRLAPNKKKIVTDHFKKQGYELFVIGGESKRDDLRNSLAHIGAAIYNSAGYIGINSGMMWMSALYKPYDEIYFWGKAKHNHVSYLSDKMKLNYMVEM